MYIHLHSRYNQSHEIEIPIRNAMNRREMARRIVDHRARDASAKLQIAGDETLPFAAMCRA